MIKLFSNGFYVARGLRASVLILLLCSFQGSDVADEYTIKGMFIYNFTKYIDWVSPKPGATFVIAVYGKSEITKSLQQIAASKKVNNKIIEVKIVDNLREAEDCQIIFIPQSNNVSLKETIDRLGAKGILIVTEDKDMASKGACINIVKIDGKIKFELNESAAKRDGLKISSQLAALAIIIK